MRLNTLTMGFLHLKSDDAGWLKSLGFFAIVVLSFVNGMLYQAHRSEKTPVSASENFDTSSLEIPQNAPESSFEKESTQELQPIIVEESYLPPFSIQAPLGWIAPWTDYALQSSILMAEAGLKKEESLPANRFVANMQELMNWVRSKNIQNPRELAIRSLKEFYQRNNVQEWDKLDQSGFEAILKRGSYAIVPVLASELENPYYLGTESSSAHYLFVYAYENGQALVHDPGTSRGKSNAYSLETLYKAYSKSPETFVLEIFQTQS